MNRKGPFRQIDVTRALRAAKAAGIKVSRFQISPEGELVIFDAADSLEQQADKVPSTYEQWKAERAERDRAKEAEQQRLEGEFQRRWRAEMATKSFGIRSRKSLS